VQAGGPPKTHLATVLPILAGAEHPGAPTLLPFPRDKLHLLSNRASVDTNACAARLLASVGVPTPEHFLRLSVREVVAAFLDPHAPPPLPLPPVLTGHVSSLLPY